MMRPKPELPSTAMELSCHALIEVGLERLPFTLLIERTQAAYAWSIERLSLIGIRLL